jgi:hypothetical protein
MAVVLQWHVLTTAQNTTVNTRDKCAGFARYARLGHLQVGCGFGCKDFNVHEETVDLC